MRTKNERLTASAPPTQEKKIGTCSMARAGKKESTSVSHSPGATLILCLSRVAAYVPLKPALRFTWPKKQEKTEKASGGGFVYSPKRQRQAASDREGTPRNARRHLPPFSAQCPAFPPRTSPKGPPWRRISSHFNRPTRNATQKAEFELPCTVNAVASVVGLEMATVLPEADSRHSPSMNAL